ncbi:hypothetical protein EV424DRAFT_1559729 [Suillus variegatus]|nr:hypothetical protein EV424DRAFT_1559729 [Suillus variegatus]
MSAIRAIYVENTRFLSVLAEYDFTVYPWLKIENGAPVLVFFTTSTCEYKDKVHNKKLRNSASMNDKAILILENSPADNYQHGAKLPAKKYTNKNLWIMPMKEEKEAETSRSKMI